MNVCAQPWQTVPHSYMRNSVFKTWKRDGRGARNDLQKRKAKELEAAGKPVKPHFWSSSPKDISPRDANQTKDYKAGEVEDLAQTVSLLPKTLQQCKFA